MRPFYTDSIAAWNLPSHRVFLAYNDRWRLTEKTDLPRRPGKGRRRGDPPERRVE